MPYAAHEVEGEPSCMMHEGFAMKLTCTKCGEEKWRCDFLLDTRRGDEPVCFACGAPAKKAAPAAEEEADAPAKEEEAAAEAPAADAGGGDY
eukprot:CAMPEP_0185690262 /NCGR_PEP_ID=MMETSP1164-20130828/1001_1 /TAXON_ID=1104430 /ORGANISM="Chrysoreinhardia sp, Strain CCMP2950" /LENGTH=91 /DNA_ID=CAMNT_0028356819 /DNA_START=32 /DNA_END=307 /DNA_ORIENTATION=+